MLTTADTDPKAGIFSTAFLPITLMNILVVTSHAVNGFITTVIAPSIVVDLGGRELMFWLFALFQVGSISAGVMAGNFKVRFGARPIFVAAASLLAIGSVMGGVANSLALVILARGLQGLAEGMLISLVYVVIADHLPARLLPRIFALSSTLWSVAAAATPLFAGLLTQYVSWRVAFLFNLPLVLVLIVLAYKFLPRATQSEDEPKPFPVRRLLLLVAALLITGFAGQVTNTGLLALIIAASSTLMVVFAALDQKAAERFMPPNLFSLRTNMGRCFTMLGLFSIGASGRTVYIVALLQAIWFMTPLAAGYTAASLAFAWTLAAWTSNRIERMSLRISFIRMGAALIMTGGLLSAFAVWQGYFWLILTGLITTGLGYGSSSPLIRQIIITQSPPQHKSIASGAMTPIQFTGAVFGAAIAGFCAIAFGLFDGAVEGSIFTVEAARNAGAALLLVFTAFPALGLLISLGLSTIPDHNDAEAKDESEALA